MLVVEAAVNLCPEEEGSGGLYLTRSDAVLLAQASPLVAAAINWVKVERLTGHILRPRRRKLPRPPTTFPLDIPRLPTQMSSNAIAALARVATLDDEATNARRAAGRAVTFCGQPHRKRRASATTRRLLWASSRLRVATFTTSICVTTERWLSGATVAKASAMMTTRLFPASLRLRAVHSVALRNDGTVVTWGTNSNTHSPKEVGRDDGRGATI